MIRDDDFLVLELNEVYLIVTRASSKPLLALGYTPIFELPERDQDVLPPELPLMLPIPREATLGFLNKHYTRMGLGLEPSEDVRGLLTAAYEKYAQGVGHSG